jgi:hypothetical protein
MEQLRAPQPEQPDAKGPQAVEVPRYRMVVEVALHDRPEPLARLRHRIVPKPPELLLDFLQLPPQALADRLTFHGKASVARTWCLGPRLFVVNRGRTADLQNTSAETEPPVPSLYCFRT